MTAKTSAAKLAAQIERGGWTDLFRRGSRRLSSRLGDRMAWSDYDFPLRPTDVADSRTMLLQPGKPVDGRLHVGWVCTPPARGSGGHTTLFRMVQAMEERGHHCTLFLYDRNADSVAYHEPRIRACWPQLRADIRSATTGIDGVDAIVATSWETAHVVASRTPQPMHRFYFIQDYEPYFYPRGALYALAEDTYRFGFTNIALGEMVASVIDHEVEANVSAVVPFGCDTAVYNLLPTKANAVPRNGVVYYAKRKVDRRGYFLAKLALERFHQLCPDQEIHVYGDGVSGWTIPVRQHGNLSPEQLNQLYNRTIASVAMSFTNISLVAEELLAAGNIPVLNDSSLARLDLCSDAAVWAPATPTGIAEALASVVATADPESAIAAAATVRRGWESSRKQVVMAIESACSVTANESLRA